MTNLEKYDQIFIEIFGVTKDMLTDYKYQDTESWDSVGHMAMIAEMEETFGIMFEMDDIIDFSSYEYGKILVAKYGVELITQFEIKCRRGGFCDPPHWSGRPGVAGDRMSLERPQA